MTTTAMHPHHTTTASTAAIARRVKSTTPRHTVPARRHLGWLLSADWERHTTEALEHRPVVPPRWF